MEALRSTARIIVRYRVAFALIAIFLLVVSIYGIQNLRFESDLRSMLPEGHPAIDDYTTLQNEFQSGDSTIIVVKVSSIEPGGVYDVRDPQVIQAIYELEQRLLQREYVTDTISIADIYMQVLGRLPENEEEAKFVLDVLPPETRNQLVSRDYTTTMIVVTISREKNSKTLVRVYEGIQEDINDVKFPKNVEVIQTGNIGITYRILELLQSDLNKTMAISFIIVLALLLYFYRSPVKALIPLTPLVFGVTMTLGAMGLLGIPLDLATTTIGAMLIGMGIDYGIHVTNRYYEERKRGRTIEEAAEEAIAETGKALLGAALTTVAGFAAMYLSSLPMLHNLATTLILGLSLAALNAVVITPSVIILEEDVMKKLKGHYEVPEIRSHSGFVGKAFRSLGEAVRRKPFAFLGAVFLITLIFGYGVTQVTTEVRLEKFVPKGMPEIEALMDIRSDFGGQDELYILVKADDVRDPTVVRSIYRFENQIKADTYYNNVFDSESIADIVVQKYGYIPDDREKIKEALKDYQGVQLVSSDYSMTVIKFTGDFSGSSIDDFRKIIRYFEEEVQNAVFPPGVSLSLTGDIYLNYVLDQLTNEEINRISMYGTVFVVVIVLLLFRRPKVSLAMITPMFLGALWTVGFMGLAGIPFTQTLAGVISMIVGLGVDYGMHLTHRFLEEMNEGNPRPIVTSIESVGPGILAGALTTAGGFLALLAGELPTIHDFGLTLAFGIFASMFAAYLVTPALLQVFYGKKIGGDAE
ncbi:MFS transporter [Thermococcus sp. GR7]|uniref:hydrophobe/amphiphile efflux-3 (HAE3) family transporter n=1 Tax=unclassified Thermococcus TaxID=2627626 RepID=UPI001431D202|nr:MULTISPECIES: hydrophobe/amphiphile efflux-3 (HAE3) family transporter [unclassified Thermococcus]NJE46158.1 MFS transporter [Thermococcus sp. GR7]NJE78206.1 MFS transporter [Thermococcus sp. GR4]NJF22355.1 MFS transporter [Thermococcus sp. GR5]